MNKLINALLIKRIRNYGMKPHLVFKLFLQQQQIKTLKHPYNFGVVL